MRFQRLTLHRPALSGVIVVTLALGIGSATALYSVIQAVLLRPFPFRDQSQLAVLWQADVARNHPFVEVSYLDARDWQTRAGAAFASIAAMSSVNFAATVTGFGEPQQLQVRVVADPFFATLGAVPALGRTLQPPDHRFEAPRVVVLGHGAWQRLFGGDPEVVGKSITLDGDAHTIVGVMPRAFRYPDGAELWAPVEQAVGAKALENRGLQWMVAVGRIRDGVTFDQARSALDVVIRGLANEFRASSATGDDEAMRAVVRPLVAEVLGTTRQALLLLLCAVGLVLFIACANVSNLLLSRGVDRRREMATRIALGASRSRLARDLLVEVLPLAAAGGVLGIGVAWIAIRSLIGIAGAELPRAEDIGLDVRAFAVASSLSLSTGLLCALTPLLQAREMSLTSAVRDDARAGASRLQRRLRDGLVIVEIALALVLLVGAALLVASFAALRSQDLGFRPEGVLTAEVTFASPAITTLDELRVVQRRYVERLVAIPGVERASAIVLRPLWSNVGYDTVYEIEGQATSRIAQNPMANLEATMPGYFGTMGIRLVAGRDFTEGDDGRAPGVIVVSESFARASWPGRDAIGRRLRINMPSSPFDDQWLTVVGIVADVRYREIETARLDIYQPYGQSTSPLRHFVIRTAGDPLAIAGAVRNAARDIDPNQPVELLTMEQIVATAMGRWRLNARLFGALAVLAVLLAAVGTYSVMNYAVSRRTQELGVRIALGAGRSQITRMVMADGLRLAAIGITIGTLVAIMVSGLLRHLLIGIGPRHPAVFAGAALSLCALAALACVLPARRAASVDPMTALRSE
ncbi:MAG TPA: ABC transporter permease [Vicinamibacterales bacterium]|nr:ABC transporter permease [Vicinamibacterales bacterium]